MGERTAHMRFPKEEFVAALCLALCVWSGQMTNSWIFPSVTTVFPLARDAGIFCKAVAYVLVALCARHAPRYLGRAAGVASLAMLVATCALSISGIASSSPLAACAFCIFYTVGFVFPEVLCFIALIRLSSNARRLCAISSAFAVSSLACAPQMGIGAAGGSLIRLAIFCIVAALLWRGARSMLERLSAASPVADLELAAPKSFLSPMHAFFSCVFLVSVIAAFGSMISQGGHEGIFVHISSAIVILLAFIVAFRRRASEDALFSFVYLGLVAGLLLVPFSGSGLLPVAQAIIAACSLCFSVLYMFVVSSVGSKNPFALLPTLGVASFANGVGTMAGALLGGFAESYDVAMAGGLLAAAGAFTFVAFIWLFFKGFSFSETVGSVEPVTEVRLPAVDSSLSRKSEHVAVRCGLTAREGEILDLLAHGRNTRFIQDKLVISPNTVRTHIKHIYQKIGVHSQQELIDLVSDEQI